MLPKYTRAPPNRRRRDLLEACGLQVLKPHVIAKRRAASVPCASQASWALSRPHEIEKAEKHRIAYPRFAKKHSAGKKEKEIIHTQYVVFFCRSAPVFNVEQSLQGAGKPNAHLEKVRPRSNLG